MTPVLLATKCPHCKTTFKVANDQLKLQSGLVRCGICNQVFNGIEHLAATTNVTNTIKINAPTASFVPIPSPPAAANDIKPYPQAKVVAPIQATTEGAASIASAPPAREFDLFDECKLVPETTSRVEPVPEFNKGKPQPADIFFASMLNDDFSRIQSKADINAKVQALLDADLQAVQQLSFVAPPPDEPVEEIKWMQAEQQEKEQKIEDVERNEEEPATLQKSNDLRSMLSDYSTTETDADEPDNDEEDGDITQLNFIRQANAKKRVTVFFSLATLLLLVLLVGQGVYQFRDLIAAAYPASKATLVSLCKLARCAIDLPAQLDAISYEADELHTLPRENTFEFSLLMRNHSSLPQAWPNIELTLKDNEKQVVLKRVFTAADYLTNPHDVSNGFPANQEQPVKLYFMVDHVKASDYVVAIFYP